MKIMIVGSGGREHALAWKLAQSPTVDEIFVAPGNGGTAAIAENIAIPDSHVPALARFAKERGVDLAVVGPEVPLVLGLSNAMAKQGIPCFGPDAYAAQLEGSKSFAKLVMEQTGVPTARSGTFDDYESAKAYLDDHPVPVVIKADGLAAGKGVTVARTREEAEKALDMCMRKQSFGMAGERVVIEEALEGEEASFLALCDGETVVPLASSQDHKPIGEGDTGPNTGGMGAYSPAPILPESELEKVCDLVARPIVRAMAASGHPFKGVLYAGLMVKDGAYKVLEYNVRFGDPECQPLLARLDSDLAELMLACVEGRLDPSMIRWKPQSSCCVVMASRGYPGSYATGKVIEGIEKAEDLEGVTVFHAGTRLEAGRIVTSGGRVLGVTALGDDLKSAQTLAYQAVDRISFEGSYVRRDIGDKGLAR
ncbi:phosphoribosylamine--glycine ligase [Oceanidesulfovibrio indonesiensis]|uniref:Phosphoribosylamine--glycine ligase n=1 Tax=Oceanidesulfovibrio indonesiensis TaxID=54767 RepID=A0A7M3MCI4_9BACT|nr:phosphoribosylamine--glycine ligase [Oceanidesulfovibrio indonesiensis]TVM15570.1 phosphoribosylamine--glycine ligase [Oceanidesulfovibrio indonesiensis]